MQSLKLNLGDEITKKCTDVDKRNTFPKMISKAEKTKF